MTQESKQKIAPGKFIEIGYDLYTVGNDGAETLVHQVDPADPEKLVFGVTRGVIEPLEKALEGLAVDDTFDVHVPADKGFGPQDPDQVVTLDKNIFLVDGKFDGERIFPGATVPMMTAEGFRISGVVTEVGEDKVTMDFNHPLAGKALRFAGKVLLVRDATDEELHPVSACGGCCGGGGDCGDGACGDKSCGGCSGGC